MRLGHLLAAAAMALGGCGRYADFVAPRPTGELAAASFRWAARPLPVLPRGGRGEWDSSDALNPSVVRHQGLLYNFYSGYDGRSWHTGLATSSDGLSWEKRGKILSPDPSGWEGDYIAANGAALRTEDKFLYWYQGGRTPKIGLASSMDGRTWTKLPNPVLAPGPRGSWDERGVADPDVVVAGGMYYMYYLGQDRARRQRLGVARSADGVRWEKLRSNPILEEGRPGTFDEVGLGEPAVWMSHGRYWMLYTGRDRQERRRIGLARSRDGVHWERVSEAPVFEGREQWNGKVVCDPSVLAEGGALRVWFGGGDVASPAENLHGQIGEAKLEPVGANLTK